jgi:hypothetical protein
VCDHSCIRTLPNKAVLERNGDDQGDTFVASPMSGAAHKEKLSLVRGDMRIEQTHCK